MPAAGARAGPCTSVRVFQSALPLLYSMLRFYGFWPRHDHNQHRLDRARSLGGLDLSNGALGQMLWVNYCLSREKKLGPVPREPPWTISIIGYRFYSGKIKLLEMMEEIRSGKLTSEDLGNQFPPFPGRWRYCVTYASHLPVCWSFVGRLLFCFSTWLMLFTGLMLFSSSGLSSRRFLFSIGAWLVLGWGIIVCVGLVICLCVVVWCCLVVGWCLGVSFSSI